MAQILPPEFLPKLFPPPVINELVEYQGLSLLVSNNEFEQFGESAGIYFSFQEVTYIRNLEQHLSQKLRAKGLVARYTFDNIKTWSLQMEECLRLAKKIAPSDLTVLITGESGTGKELIAHAIHNASPRAVYPFIAINCAAFPENLLESELFGYEGGAFTGALKNGKTGLFEQAHNGTIFLDEVGDMPHSVQLRLLRVLQERQIMRVGSQQIMDVNIRVLAATNKNLHAKIAEGSFREDLFYRLNVLPIVTPPLRDRVGDILPLLRYFIENDCKKNFRLSREAEILLSKYKWPGNIRELSNVAAYLSFMAEDIAGIEHLPAYILDSVNNFDAEVNSLSSQFSLDVSYQLLLCLSLAAQSGAGRKSLQNHLTELGVAITEGEIRRLLNLLAELELVSSHVGRGGSRLTAKGLIFLKYLGNRKQGLR